MEAYDDPDPILLEEYEDWIVRCVEQGLEPLDNSPENEVAPLHLYGDDERGAGPEIGEVNCDSPEYLRMLEELWQLEESQFRQEVRQKEFGAVYWLSKEIDRPPEELIAALDLVRYDNAAAYRRVAIKKRSGGERQIDIPAPLLKKVQKKINRNMLRWIGREKNSFGFAGGSIVEAIRPHLASSTILMVDLKDAFPTVKSDDIFYYFRLGSGGIARCYDGMSWRASTILARLTCHQGRLPQGPPTSPRLFDAICYRLDRKLAKLAANVGGAYTRYADNIFFSVKNPQFPRPVKQAILKIIERRGGPWFEWHKLRVCRLGHGSTRLLGLNIIGKELHNTRKFKRRLRLAIHHVRWLHENGRDFEPAWAILKGMYSFALPATLPAGTVRAFEDLKKTIDSGSI